MNKLFLFAVSISLLFAVPLAFASAFESAGASGASLGSARSASTASHPGALASASSEGNSGAAIRSSGAGTASEAPSLSLASSGAAAVSSGASGASKTFSSKSGESHAPISLPFATKAKSRNNTLPPNINGTPVYSVVVLPSSASLVVGQVKQFNAYFFINGVPVQDVPFTWSTTGGVGTVDQNGQFIATSAGNGAVTATRPLTSIANVSGSASIAVSDVPSHPSNNSSYDAYILVLPSHASLIVGDNQQFSAYLIVNGGSTIEVPFTWSTTGGVGTVDQNGQFTAANAGNGLVFAKYYHMSLGRMLSGNASVSVNSSVSQANVSSISVTPDPASLFVGQGQQFIATAYDASGKSLGVLPNSNLAWSATYGIGTIGSNGTFTATGVGSGLVTAYYSGALRSTPISDSASVTVSQFVPGPNGGGSQGGSNSNGGASFKTSTTVSFSCTGKPGTVKITVYDSNVKNATVEIIYMGGAKSEKVLVKEITGTTTLSFTPGKAGDYTLRVNVGTDQTNANFFVPHCGPETLNVTQNITVRLEPVRELLFSKLVTYPGGFSKRFAVYKITDGQAESFESDIVLYLNYTGNATKYDFEILDSVPSSVLARSNQITFADRPSVLSSEPKFEWEVKSVSKGGRLSYAYSFSRPLTEQMIALFDAPTIREAGASPQAVPVQDSGLLAASIGPIFGISVPLLGVLFAFLVLLALLYFFLFGKKKEEG